LGTYEFFERGLNSTTDPKWAVGLAVRWEFFDGFGGSHRVRPCASSRKGSGSSGSTPSIRSRTLVEQRFDEYVSAREQYESLGVDARSGRGEPPHRAQGVRRRVSAPSLDVVDAELSLARTQIDRLTALYELELSLARLLEASGQSDRFAEYLDRGTPAEERR
jgi:outer membrane protein TolC